MSATVKVLVVAGGGAGGRQTDGDYTVHTFLTSDTWVCVKLLAKPNFFPFFMG